jgi:hypothetical protein
MFLKHRILGLGLAVALLATPVRAGEVDRYLPKDTEVYSFINIRQILGSGLVKKVGVENIKALLEQQQEVADVLKSLELDPLKDLDRIISTGPSTGEQDKGLHIIQGRFNIEKFKERADKEAKDNKDIVKPFKIGGHTAYEVVIPDANLSVFVGFASKNTILVAMSKDYLGDALKVKADGKITLNNKAFQAMLEKLDDKQSMALAMVVNGEALNKGPLADVPGNIKEYVAKVNAINGGITLTDGFKIEFSAGTKAAEDARSIKEGISQGIDGLVGVIALLGGKELAPVKELLKAIKTTSKDKSVTIKAEISGEELNKLLPGAPKDQ